MRVLFLAARLPYPPLKGDQTRGYHQLRILSQKHDITLVSFAEQGSDSSMQLPLKEFCTEIVCLQLTRNHMAANLLKGVVSPLPLQTLLYQDVRMSKQITSLCAARDFDVVHVQLARMAPYMIKHASLPRYIDLIDALSLNMERRYRRGSGLSKFAAYAEWKRLSRFEREVCNKYDHATVVSETDRQQIGDFKNLTINSNGVDFSIFKYVPADAPIRQSNRLIFTGNMSYFPNVDAVKWFVANVFPILRNVVPDVQLHIVGANPHPSVFELSREYQSIFVTGYVKDIAAELSKATLAVVPLQSGSGMQFKVIEAMATGTPVVATQYALGGLQAIDGHHLLQAQNPTAFGNKVLAALKSIDLRKSISLNARKLVEERFSWESSVNDIDAKYADLVDARKVRWVA